MKQIHHKKSHDYANNTEPFANYYFAGMLSKLFDSPDDAGFVGRIGEKMFRIANLENQGLNPVNEMVEDTENDICVITLLWMAARRERRGYIKENGESPVSEYAPYGFGGTLKDIVAQCDTKAQQNEVVPESSIVNQVQALIPHMHPHDIKRLAQIFTQWNTEPQFTKGAESPKSAESKFKC